jgi:hypothetical protein
MMPRHDQPIVTLPLRQDSAMTRIGTATLALLLVLQSLASAGENEWTYVGLYPEYVTDIIVHPNNPDILYVSAYDVFYDTTREGGIFKTTDHGLTWDTVGFRHYRVNDLAFDPQHPETIWAACDVSGVFRSTDGGEAWENRSEGLYLGGADNHGAIAIAVSPFDPDVLMCGGLCDMGPGWLYRTTNGGEYWEEVDFPYNYCFSKVVFDTSYLERVFALDCTLERVWISEDAGASFRAIPAPDYIMDFALDPFRRDWIWGIGAYSFLYSQDAGSTWVESDSTFPLFWAGSLMVSHDSINTVYARTGGRVLKSTDLGVSWSMLVEGWPTSANFTDAASIVGKSPTELWAGLYYHGILSYTVVDTSSVVESSGPEALGISLELYPNPATSVLYLNLSTGPLNGTFSLYNILGQRVFSTPYSNFKGTRAIRLPTALPSGAYFVTLIPERASTALPMMAYPLVIVK